MSGKISSIEIKGATVVALEGCETWPCDGCGRALRIGDRAYINVGGRPVHALPEAQGGCDPAKWPENAARLTRD